MLFILYARIPFWMNIVVGPMISYLSIVMNIVIFVALFHKKIRSPTTVVMQGLALADGLTATCTYGFEPFFNLHYEELGNDNYSKVVMFHTKTQMEEMKKLVGLKFLYCLIHYCLSNLGDTFHLVSILLTAYLGLQKLLAVSCPIWSKIYINERKSCFVCCMCFLFTLVVNVPRFFIISISRGIKGDACLVSEPHHTIQKYILAYYPIIYSIILVVAVVIMLISTCYIISILWRRKLVRGHAEASRSEKKSCILIVCVMTVFFLAEVPRLYVNSTLFGSYRSNLDKQNIALQKMASEADKIYSACLKESFVLLTGESCISDFDKISANDKRIIRHDLVKLGAEMEKWFEYFARIFVKVVFKYQFKQKYYEYLKDDLVRLTTLGINRRFKLYQQFVYDYEVVGYCNDITNSTYADNLFQCFQDEISKYKLVFGLLIMSPYSEPMNYLLNIIWEHHAINVNNLKLLIETLKLSMIIGCASNFLIYIVMSETLRDALKKTFKCKKY